MNERWSLDNLYESVESDEFKNDLTNIENLIEKLNSWTCENFLSTNNADEKILSFCNFHEEILSYNKISTYLQLRLSVNSEDSEALKILNKFENIVTLTASYSTLFMQFLKKIDNIEMLINSNEQLKEYEFFIYENLTNAKYMLEEKEEVLLSKMKVTGSGSFEKLRDSIISSMKININIEDKDKIITFPEVRNLAYHKDSSVRKAAYDAEINAYKNIEIPVAACLNSIKAEIITECKLRGYNDVLEKTLIDSRLEKETLDALLEAINESLPELRKYFLHKAKKLGYDNGLPFYELFAPMGEVDYKFTYEEASNIINECFEKFSPELSNLSKRAFSNNWIDATPMPGKTDGAFCAAISPIKESRILSNFTGSFSDLSTLAHELGHAFHGYSIFDEKIINQDYTMPIAETASIFCEKIIEEEFMKKADDKAKLTLLDKSLTESTQVLIDVISRFYFEDSFIKERENGSLSVEEINNLMESAQKKIYGDGLDENYLHKFMWIAKPHYYSASANYYNFPYAFGFLFSQGVYELYRNCQDKEAFILDYKNLLRISGKNSLEDSAKSMGIDIRDKKFWLKSIEAVVREVAEFVSL